MPRYTVVTTESQCYSCVRPGGAKDREREIPVTTRQIAKIVSVAAFAIAVASSHVAFAQTTYYVDASCGDDSWTGITDICEAPDGPKATIAGAIAVAVSGDTILVGDGEHAVPVDTGLRLDGRDLTIESVNGPAMCTINCAQAGRAFTLDAGETSNTHINGFTISNGDSIADGGAILCDGVSARISNCTISNCEANNGGGVAIVNGGHPVLRNVDFRSSVAISRGAAVFVRDSDVTLDTCTVLNGSATQGGAVFAESFSQFTITNAHFETCLASDTGGAILLRNGGQASISDATLNNNLASSGAGLAVSNTDLTLQTSAFLAHQGTPLLVLGGSLVADGIECDNNRSNGATFIGVGSVLVQNSSFERNRNAGLHVDGCTDVTILTTRFDNNSPGLRVSRTEATIADCQFFDNERGSLLEGGLGGLYLVTFDSCVFNGNRAGEGGALKVTNSNILRLVNCLLAGNQADTEGGAIMVRELAGLLLLNCTLANNSAGVAAGGVGVRAGGDSLIANSILWANLAPVGRNIAIDGSQDFGTMRIKYSNIRGGELAIPVGTSASLVWDLGNIDVDPKFVDSLRGDYRLRNNSRCIDAGNNGSVPADRRDFDLLGNPRFLDHPEHPDTGSGTGPIVDIGAAEHPGM